jgi:hypothetical protein
VFVEGVAALAGGADVGAGLAVDECLFDLHVALGLEPCEVRAEVAVGELQEFAQAGDVRLLVAAQRRARRQDAQPRGRPAAPASLGRAAPLSELEPGRPRPAAVLL